MNTEHQKSSQKKLLCCECCKKKKATLDLFNTGKGVEIFISNYECDKITWSEGTQVHIYSAHKYI